MTVKVEIINQPCSGEFEERIYDVESPWNSQFWTWVKFTDENGIIKIGHFRGSPAQVQVSNRKYEIIVLTSDYAYRLDTIELNIIETKSQPEYQDVVVSLDGEFIFHNYYEITKMGNSFSEMTELESPFKMDDIHFLYWDYYKLIFTCEEFLNWSRKETMILDTVNWKIEVQKSAS